MGDGEHDHGDGADLVLKRIGKRRWRLLVNGKPTGPAMSYEDARPFIIGQADRRELLARFGLSTGAEQVIEI